MASELTMRATEATRLASIHRGPKRPAEPCRLVSQCYGTILSEQFAFARSEIARVTSSALPLSAAVATSPRTLAARAVSAELRIPHPTSSADLSSLRIDA